MRDKEGNVEIVETPEEFLDKFVDSSWYNAIFITYVCKKCLKKKVVKIEK